MTSTPYRRPPFKVPQIFLFYLLYLISLLPFGAMYLLSDGLSWLFWHVIKYRKKVVLQNLANAFPEKTETERLRIGREFYRNLTDVILETVKLTSVTPHELRQRITMRHDEEMVALVTSGQPVIILASHHTNWEWVFVAGPISYPFPVDGVYKPLSSPFFEQYMRHLRTRFGANPIKMKETLRHLIAHKGQGRVLAMVADQTPPFGEIQHWVNFLNQETAFYTGAEKIAASFKYPVFFLHTHRVSRGRYVFSINRIDNQAGRFAAESKFPITDVFAESLENLIKAEPENYLWSHRRWKHKRPV